MSTIRTTDDTFTHILDLGEGDVLTFRADHGGGYVDIRRPKSRYPRTVRLSEEAFTHHARRLGEVAARIPATRRPA